MKKSSCVQGWAIRHWRQGLYAETIRRTRSETIDCFKEQFGITDKHWRDDCRSGVHRAVRVTATEANP